VHRGLLVPDEHVFEFVLLEDFVVNVEYRAARIAENEFDPLFLQAAYNYFRTSDFRSHESQSRLSIVCCLDFRKNWEQ
jgi:hypothetical protein